MEYYTLGGSGLRVSQLALGTLTFGTDWGWGTAKEEARKIFDAYVDSGGNIVDSADLYLAGTSETWLGEFVAERSLRGKMVISTKFSYNADPDDPNSGGNGRKNMIQAVEGSLRRLNTDYIDLFILHCWDMLTPVEEVIETFSDLIRQGKIRYAGLSNVPAWYASRAQTLCETARRQKLCALQLEYSLVERSIENEFVPMGTTLDMGIMAWSPLGSGMLSGKYRPSANQDFGTGRIQVMKDSTNPAFAKLSERNWKIVEELSLIATELGRTMAQVAINWVANRPGVATTILGATRLEQIQETLASLEFQIPAELMSRLNAVSQGLTPFPYSFFTPEMEAMLAGGNPVGSKPAGYHNELLIRAGPAGVQ